MNRIVVFLCMLFMRLEIKPCRLGSRIRDAETFWYKTEIKIIYFVTLCLIVLIVPDCIVYPDPIFLIIKKYQTFRVRVNHTIRHNQKLKNGLIFFWGWSLIFLGFKTFPEMSLNFCISRIRIIIKWLVFEPLRYRCPTKSTNDLLY